MVIVEVVKLKLLDGYKERTLVFWKTLISLLFGSVFLNEMIE